jgi:hypothetical protein
MNCNCDACLKSPGVLQTLTRRIVFHNGKELLKGAGSSSRLDLDQLASSSAGWLTGRSVLAHPAGVRAITMAPERQT